MPDEKPRKEEKTNMSETCWKFPVRKVCFLAVTKTEVRQSTATGHFLYGVRVLCSIKI